MLRSGQGTLLGLLRIRHSLAHRPSFPLFPLQRLAAKDALDHPWFNEYPPAVEPALLPHWPAKAEGHHVRRLHSPSAPLGGQDDEMRELQYLLDKGGGGGGAAFRLK